MTDDTDIEANEAEYENRNGVIQQTIDALAQYEESEIEEHGMKAEIAREHGVEEHRIHYVLDRWEDLVEYRRAMLRDPVEPDAVKAAYEDETMQKMASSDGGQTTVSIDFTLDEAFRAMKILPGDMGLQVYRQLLTSEFNRATLRRELED